MPTASLLTPEQLNQLQGRLALLGRPQASDELAEAVDSVARRIQGDDWDYLNTTEIEISGLLGRSPAVMVR